jgi:hypothetical protein
VLHDKFLPLDFSARVARRGEKRKLMPCQILHTVLVHLEIAATKITTFTNMALKTGA